MAERVPRKRKPRIRKTAPTVRERAVAAQAKATKEKPRRIRRLLAEIPSPFRRLHLHLHLPQNRLFNALRAIGRFVKKILSKLAPRYFINSWREVRQVAWPNRRETWRLTLAVFVFALVFGALVAGVDKGLDELFKHLVLK